MSDIKWHGWESGASWVESLPREADSALVRSAVVEAHKQVRALRLPADVAPVWARAFVRGVESALQTAEDRACGLVG